MCALNHSGSVDAQDAQDADRDEVLAGVEIALLGLIFLLAAVLNAALLLVLWRQRRHTSRMRVFVFHLCLADLVVAFFQVCPQLVWDITERFPGPDAMCRVVKYLQVLGMFSSTYMIVVMTIDRYQAVCKPMLQLLQSRARLNLLVCSAWGASVLGSLPQAFIFSRVEVAPGVFDCWATFAQPWGLQTYITWTTLVIFVLPVVTIVVCQARICRAIHMNLFHKLEPRGLADAPRALGASGVARMSRARLRTLRMTAVIVLAYILCWVPFFTVQLWSAWDSHAPKETATFTVLMLLASLNSCANPCIYLGFSGHFRKGPLALLCRRGAAGGESPHDERTVVSTLYTSFKNIPEGKSLG